MSAPSFNSTQAVRFDLARGAVRAGAGNNDRVLLVPTSALDELARSAPPSAIEALGRALGSAIGQRAAARIGNAEKSSLEEFITQLAGEAAVSGLGVWSVERWGRALVIVLQDCPAPAPLIAPVVRSAVEAASGRQVGCTLLVPDEPALRVLVSSQDAVDRVQRWMAEGMSWGDAISKLHGAGS